MPINSGKSIQPHLRKRSITLAGHQTSIALEPTFWRALDALAKKRDTSTAKLILSIDQSRDTANLSSAIRVTLLEDLQAQLAANQAE